MKRVMVLFSFCFVFLSSSSQRSIGNFTVKDEGHDPCHSLSNGVTIYGSLLDADLIENEIHLLIKNCITGEIVGETGNIEQYIVYQEEVQCDHRNWNTLFTYSIKVEFDDICEEYTDRYICLKSCLYVLENGELIPFYKFSDRSVLTRCKYVYYEGGLMGCGESFTICCPENNAPAIDKSGINDNISCKEKNESTLKKLVVELLNNPVDDKIILKIIPNENLNNVTIMLTDINGNVLINKNIDKRNFELYHIETSFLPFGVYPLIISSGNTKIVNLILKN